MKITIVTLFPDMFAGFLQESIVKRAQEKGVVEIDIVQLRDYAVDDNGTVDDRPYGGGAGMVLMAEPVIAAIRAIGKASKNDTHNRKRRSMTLLTSPRGTRYSQEKALDLSKMDHLVIVAGHYEAVDERVMSEIDEEVSIGDYVLTGGELPAAVIVDSVVRLLPGVLKKEDAAAVESFFKVDMDELVKAVGEDALLDKLKDDGVKEVQLLEYPHYTRPQEYQGESVPDVLLGGHHAEIRTWHLQQAYALTKERRPDLLWGDGCGCKSQSACESCKGMCSSNSSSKSCSCCDSTGTPKENK